MKFSKGDKVELVKNHGPYTHLMPGIQGKITFISKENERPTAVIAWKDEASTVHFIDGSEMEIKKLKAKKKSAKAKRNKEGSRTD